MIIDGRKIAEEIMRSLEGEREHLPHTPRLGVVMGKGDAATESFVRIKTRAAERLGVELLRAELSEGATVSEAISAVDRLAKTCDGVIVQLPLPSQISTEIVLAALPRERDIDGINPTLQEENRLVRAPVAGAIAEILFRANVDTQGKHAVVIGNGRLVGKPAAHLLRDRGAHVLTLTESDGGDLSALHGADIIVSGAGTPGLITPDLIDEGVILIDAGTSESGGKVVGDAHPDCSHKAALFTPVPGGVGPIAVSMIFKNLFDLIRTK